MSRRSFWKKKGIQTVEIRFSIPGQLRNDLRIVSAYSGWNDGEIVTVALMEYLKVFVKKWNEEHVDKIPDLQSLQVKVSKVDDIIKSL